jgi:predicted Rossmann fold flavoprotein
MTSVDVVVIGAGAAGMMCAAVAGQRGQRVVLIDHATKLAEKIRISGGGRCNFTNRVVRPEHFVSENRHFARAALEAYTPQDFIAMVDRHGIAWHEKHRGQLFCDDSSELIIKMLRHECDLGQVQWRMPEAVQAIEKTPTGFTLSTSSGAIEAAKLVIATGGTAVPQVGATDFGLVWARRFGLKIVEPRPALVPLLFDAQTWAPFQVLAGVSLEAGLYVETASSAKASRQARAVGAPHFLEDVLFTHRGLSGPGILQISTYWQPGQHIELNLAPQHEMVAALINKKANSRQQIGSVLGDLWPKRLAEQWLGTMAALRIAEVTDQHLKTLGERINRWSLLPTGTAGFKKAEVMKGGVDTNALNQRTFEAKAVPGLHFIGEVVDVTGWLGGYNFQWAWASGFACGQSV